MRKMISAALVAMFLAITIPVDASETRSADYSVAAGFQLGGIPEEVPRRGFAIIACQGPPEGEICEEHDLAPIGGYGIDLSDIASLSGVVVTIADANFDSTYTSVCVYTLPAHSICEDKNVAPDNQDIRASGCGSVELLAEGGDIENLDHIAGFVYSAYLDADSLEACFGSSGSATAVIN